jgi:aminoglycoside 6'-N-acetyltransferase I
MGYLLGNTIVRDANASDAAVWEALRRDLWPDGADDHAQEIASYFAGTLEEPAAVLMAEDADGKIVGFVELSIRTDIVGFEGRRTGYVEGLYLRPEFRGRGIARRLLQSSRAWARQQGCEAFASDRAGRIVVDRDF